MMHKIVDSHCHLDYIQAKGANIDDIIARMHSQNVAACVTISTKLQMISDILKFSQKHPSVVCSAGIHPHETANETVTSDALVDIAQHPDIIAIGETGLDYYYNYGPKDLQQKSFAAHIEAASETDLPLIVHTREADKDTIKILHHHYKQKPFAGVIHCFTSTQWLGDAAIEIGMAISVSGIITFKNAQDIRNSIKTFKPEHLLIETDAPFLAPVPQRGQMNEPSFISHTLSSLATLLDMDHQQCANMTTTNFMKFFKKANERLGQKGVFLQEQL